MQYLLNRLLLFLCGLLSLAAQGQITSTPTMPLSCSGTVAYNLPPIPASWTYEWQQHHWPPNSAPTPIGSDTSYLDSLCAGSYSLLLDSAGTTMQTYPFIIYTTVLVDVQTTDHIHGGACDGSVTINVLSGSLPAMAVWPDGSYGFTRTDLCPGEYTVIVYDSGADSAVVHFTIGTNYEEFPMVVATADAPNAYTCTGSAQLIGNYPPSYTRRWMLDTELIENASDTLDSLCPGTYTLYLDSADTEIRHSHFYVVNQEQCGGATLSINSIDPTSETSTDGSITLFDNGTISNDNIQNYTYIWWKQGDSLAMHGTGFEAAITLEGLQTGTYRFLTYDDLGCASSAYITLQLPYVEPEPIPLSATVDVQKHLHGGPCNGSASLNITGGTAPYTAVWTGGLTGLSVTGFCPGILRVTIHDSLNDSLVINFPLGVVYTENPIAAVTQHATDHLTCDGAAVIAADYEFPPSFTYRWAREADSTLVQLGGIAIDSLCAGIYWLYIDSASEEMYRSRFAIVNNDLCSDLQVNISTNNPSTATSLDGTANFHSVGANQYYSYVWWMVTDSLNTSGYGALESFWQDGLGAGEYKLLTYDDTYGCTVESFFTLEAPSPPSPLQLLPLEIIHEANCAGSILISVTGGATPYTYVWSNGDTTSNNVVGLCPGEYHFTVFDAVHDSVTGSFTLYTFYGNLPYSDSLMQDSLYTGLIENCDIDYPTISNALLSAVVFDSVNQQILVTWEVHDANGVTYLIDSLPFSGPTGTYYISTSAYCPGKSAATHINIQGQFYFGGYGPGVAGIAENNALSGIQLSPHPFDASFMVSFPVKGNYDLLLLDATGRTVYETRIQDSDQFVVHPHQALAPGSYFLKIAQKGQFMVLKLVH